ncbi:hypothetical protein EPN87_03890 [archaeon]|nr:MAG: hypothetical protein EPN87_03890 [archaeon]
MERLQLAVIASIVYAVLSVTYSFVGLLSPQPPVNVVGYITAEEILGHALFGFAVGIFSFDLVIALQATAFALAVDGGHLLTQLGVPVNPGVSHSLTFMILSTLLLGYVFRNKISFRKMAAIAMAAFLSHMAFDIIDGGFNGFQLFNPFTFASIMLPVWSVAALELLGIAFVAFAFKENILSLVRR